MDTTWGTRAFIYLESNIMQEVNRRINIARTLVQKMDQIWRSKAVNQLRTEATFGRQHLPWPPMETKGGPSPGKCKRNWMPSKCGLTDVYYECLGKRKDKWMRAPEAENQRDAVRTGYQQKIEILWSCHEAGWPGGKPSSKAKRKGMRGRGRRRTAWHSDMGRGGGWMQTVSSIPGDRVPW